MSILNFLKNKHVLITGTTGFVGKVLLEKFLFLMDKDIKIFVLIRNKKGSSLIERFKKEIIDSHCFDRLRKIKPDFENWFLNIVKPIHGDLLKNNLDLHKEDEDFLTNNLEIIINCAASVDFNARLDEAINININGTLKMFDLAKKCKKLQNFLHVSTAYTNSNLKGWINEEVYPINANPEEIIEKLSKLSVEEILQITPSILQEYGYPNTYTFTKSLTERILEKSKGKYPITIIRPTIIGSSWKEPFIGWVDTVSAGGALYLLGGIGILKFAKGLPTNIGKIFNLKKKGDQIPVDLVCDCIIVASAAYANDTNFHVLHSGSSDRNPVTWGQSTNYVLSYWHENEPEKKLSYAEFELIPSDFKLKLKKLKQKIPVSLFSKYAEIFGSSEIKKKANRLKKIIQRSEMIGNTFQHFTINEWIFSTKNINFLNKYLENDPDRHLFNLDVKDIDWYEYLRHFGWGLHKFVLKENIEPPSFRKRKDVLSKGKSNVGYFNDVSWAKDNGKEHYPLKRDAMKNNIMNSESVKEAILKEGADGHKKALEMCNIILSNYNMRVIKVFAWAMHKVFKSMYEKIVIDLDKISQLQEFEKKGPVILIPNHVSYIDFLVISYIFYAFGIKCPYIHATEDFLNISIVSRLFRSSGAFFIKKKGKYGELYRAIICEYLKELLNEGGNLEFFIEVSRTRSGKLTRASNLVFDLFAESYFKNKFTKKNITIIPVSINYEKVLEGETFPFELLGEEKMKENLLRIIRSATILNKNFGRVFVEFGEPIFLDKFNQNCENLKIPEKVLNLRSLIMHELNVKAVVMPTNIVAAVLLMSRKGITEDALITRSEWIAKELKKRKKKIASLMSGSSLISVPAAVKLIENYISRKKDMFGLSITPKVDYKNILLLSYYRNGLVNVFSRESKLACSLVAFGHQIAWKEGVSTKRLNEEFSFLNNLFTFEFYEEEKDGFNQLLEKMKFLDVIHIENQLITVKNEKMITFLCSLIWPFVESYWISCVHLFSLKNVEKFPIKKKLIQQIQWFAETMYEERVIEFYESCSQDTIRHAFKIFKDKDKCYKLGVSDEKLTDLENHLNKFLKHAYAKTVNSPIDIARKSMLLDFPFMPKL